MAPKTLGQILCGWTIVGVKGAIAAGLVYWTVAEGIWGDSADTEDFYCRVRDTIQADPSIDSTVPSLEYMKYKILDTYNQAVIRIIHAMIAVPLFLGKKISDALNPCEPEKEVEEPPKKKKRFCFSANVKM